VGVRRGTSTVKSPNISATAPPGISPPGRGHRRDTSARATSPATLPTSSVNVFRVTKRPRVPLQRSYPPTRPSRTRQVPLAAASSSTRLFQPIIVTTKASEPFGALGQRAVVATRRITPADCRTSDGEKLRNSHPPAARCPSQGAQRSQRGRLPGFSWAPRHHVLLLVCARPRAPRWGPPSPAVAFEATPHESVRAGSP
jgi:hypothetical protein